MKEGRKERERENKGPWKCLSDDKFTNPGLTLFRAFLST